MADGLGLPRRRRRCSPSAASGTGTCGIPSTRQFRPRTVDGTWLTPYDPVDGDHQFHEGGAYQYQWLVPQDPAGLVDLIGGPRAAQQRLDAFFAYDHLLADPARTARTDWIASPYDYYAKPTYNPNNEPDLLAPYMYLWAGAPAKTATVVRAAMTLFTTGPDGMTGNDDLGTMSAWYVFSSLGLYPTMSGADFLALSSPQFPAATVRIGRFGHRQGGTLTVTAPGVSDTARYTQGVAFRGHDVRRTSLSWSSLAQGGALTQRVGSTPSSWGTRATDAPPSIDHDATDHRRHVDATLDPAAAAVPAGPAGSAAQTVRTTVHLLVQGPNVLRPSVQVKAPHGWPVQVGASTPAPVRSDGVPAAATATVTVRVPPGTPAGTYPVTVSVAAPQANTVVRTLTVAVQPATACVTVADGQCAVDLRALYNRDGAAAAAQSDQGDFDGYGWSYDADLLPAAGPVTWDGVTYTAPDPTGTAANFVESHGQRVPLTAGDRGAVRIVAASHNGPVNTTIGVEYADGTSARIPVVVGDWAGAAPAADTVVLAMPHRIRAGQGVDGPPVALFGLAVALTPGVPLRSLTLPDDGRVEVYAVTLTP